MTNKSAALLLGTGYEEVIRREIEPQVTYVNLGDSYRSMSPASTYGPSELFIRNRYSKAHFTENVQPSEAAKVTARIALYSSMMRGGRAASVMARPVADPPVTGIWKSSVEIASPNKKSASSDFELLDRPEAAVVVKSSGVDWDRALLMKSVPTRYAWSWVALTTVAFVWGVVFGLSWAGIGVDFLSALAGLLVIGVLATTLLSVRTGLRRRILHSDK